MSKRKLRSAGTTGDQTLDKSKVYKYNSNGTLVEATSIGNDDIVFSGSKSSLRRMADLERNLSILAAKALTDDASGGGYGGYVDYSKKSGQWYTARTLSLAGDASGSVSIDGSGNMSLTVAVANDSHTHDGRYYTESEIDTKLSANATASNTYTDNAISALVNGASAAFDTLKEIQDAMATDAELAAAIAALTIGNGTMTISAGAGMTGGGSFTANQTGNSSVSIAHADTSSVSSVNNTGNTFIQDLTFDGYGHVTSVGSATATDTNTTYSAGNGLSLTGTTFAMSGSFTGAFSATGEITAFASDGRLKTEVVAIEGALAKVEAMRGVTYRFNEIGQGFGLGDAEHVGVIAQEVEAVMPQLVVDSANEGYKTVKYDKLTAVLIEAVKELSAEVKTLKARLGDSSL